MRFDAREIFAALSRHEVDYVTVGGIALQAYGAQRMTQDLDVVIASSKVNLEKLASALIELDARILDPDGERSRSTPSADLLGSSDQRHLITIHGRLDVLTPPAALGDFEDFLKRSHRVNVGDVTVSIASRDDLLVLKRQTGRPQDLADIKLLESLDPE